MSMDETQHGMPGDTPSREQYASVEAIGSLERQLADMQRELDAWKDLYKEHQADRRLSDEALEKRVTDAEAALDELERRFSAFLQTPAAQHA